jgi:hypothetical protein
VIRPAYLDRLRIEQVAIDRWRLLSEFRFDSAVIGARVIVDPGIESDLESIPRQLSIAYAVLRGYAHGPALLHDWAYSFKLWSRAQADALFLEAMRTDGSALGIPRVPRWRRGAFYAGVRVGGWISW